MSFKEKIDKIISASELRSGKRKLTINKIEATLEVDGTIYKNYKADTYPKDQGLISKMLNKFGISSEWWETGKGEIFIANGTPVPESDKKNIDDEGIVLLAKAIAKHAEVIHDQMIKIKQLEDFIRSKGLTPPL